MFSKPKTFGRVTIHPGRKRKNTDHMGRFGGGWQWKVGITAGSIRKDRNTTVMVALLVDEYRVVIAPKAAK